LRRSAQRAGNGCVARVGDRQLMPSGTARAGLAHSAARTVSARLKVRSARKVMDRRPCPRTARR
jgi:hypothetical protein